MSAGDTTKALAEVDRRRRAAANFMVAYLVESFEFRESERAR